MTTRPILAMAARTRVRYPISMDTDKFKVDRRAFSVVSLDEQDEDEKRYWLSKTPLERLEAVELMRQVVYGYDPATTRLQRVLEIAQRE